ncbi:MAG: PAS domain-containing protein [Kofleriaceae bacterium]
MTAIANPPCRGIDVSLDDLSDAAIDALPLGVVALDEADRVARLGRAAARQAGVTAWRVLGRTLAEVAVALGAPALVDAVARFRASPAAAQCLEVTFDQRRGRRTAAVELRRGREPGRVYLCIAA